MVVTTQLPPRLSPAIADLLAACIGYPTPAKIQAVWEDYGRGNGRQLWLAMDGAQIAGLIGFKPPTEQRLIIRHIAVDAAVRGRGLGRKLIETLAARYPGHLLEAETDREAVGFYRRCGFAISSLGERFPGCERFRCVRTGDGAQAGARSAPCEPDPV